LLKVLASEPPLERFGDRFVIALEFQQSGGKVREIVRGKNLALNDGKVNLDLDISVIGILLPCVSPAAR
jgi:hypothetical protein